MQCKDSRRVPRTWPAAWTLSPPGARGGDALGGRGSGLRVLCALIALGVTTCTLKQLRSATYPPDFHYITREQIQTTMGGLAVQVVALDEILGQDEGPGPEDRDRIVAILETMKGLAADLKRGRRSNHPRIDTAAPLLQETIERALRAARSTPPSYFAAGQVSGSCTYCHPSPLAVKGRPSPGV